MSQLSRNIVYNVLGQGMFIVLSFVAVRYVFRLLGPEALGIVYFTLTTSAVLGALVEMGISATTVREVSRRLTAAPGYIVALMRTASLVYWSAYAAIGLALWFAAPRLVAEWINPTALDTDVATRTLQVLGAGALLGVPRALYSSFLRGLERMDLTNLLDVGTAAVQQAGVLAVLGWGGSLLDVAAWLAVSFGLSVAAYLVAAARFVPWRAFVPGYSTEVVRRNRRFSLHMMSISVLAMIHTQADKILVAKLLPLGTLGIYSVAYGSLARAQVLNAAVTQALLPAFASLGAAGDRDAVGARFREVQDLMAVASAPFVAAVPFFAIPLFTFLFDRNVAGALLLPVALLAVGFYMNGILAVPYVLSVALGKPEITTRLNLLALLTVLPATAVLIAVAGLAGAALGWVTYHVFAWWYAVPRILRECLGGPVGWWYGRALRTLALAAGTYGIAWWLTVSLAGESLDALVASYLLGSAAFLAAGYLASGGGFRESVRRRLSRLTMMRWDAKAVRQAAHDP